MHCAGSILEQFWRTPQRASLATAYGVHGCVLSCRIFVRLEFRGSVLCCVMKAWQPARATAQLSHAVTDGSRAHVPPPEAAGLRRVSFVQTHHPGFTWNVDAYVLRQEGSDCILACCRNLNLLHPAPGEVPVLCAWISDNPSPAGRMKLWSSTARNMVNKIISKRATKAALSCEVSSLYPWSVGRPVLAVEPRGGHGQH